MDNSDSNDGSRLLTYEERAELRKKLIKITFNTLVRTPLIGTCIIILIIILLAYINPQTDAGKSIIRFFSYACSISLLWLIVGVFKYLSVINKLPKISPELPVQLANSTQNIKIVKSNFFSKYQK